MKAMNKCHKEGSKLTDLKAEFSKDTALPLQLLLSDPGKFANNVDGFNLAAFCTNDDGRHFDFIQALIRDAYVVKKLPGYTTSCTKHM